MKSQDIDNANEDGGIFLPSMFLVMGLKMDGEERECLELTERILT